VSPSSILGQTDDHETRGGRGPSDPAVFYTTLPDATLIRGVKGPQVQDEGYQQMVGVANLLVDAIEKVMRSELPAGGSKTGGGTAHPHR
jgi:hypothetical protein